MLTALTIGAIETIALCFVVLARIVLGARKVFFSYLIGIFVLNCVFALAGTGGLPFFRCWLCLLAGIPVCFAIVLMIAVFVALGFIFLLALSRSLTLPSRPRPDR